MERLTKKDGANRNFVDVKRFDDDEWIISEMADGVTIKFSSKAIDKLAEIEDFMDEYEIEDLKMAFETLTDSIKHNKFNYEELHKYKNKLVIENQALKDRWQKLKEFAKIEHDWGLDENYQDHSYAIRLILDKMQELEKESK